MERIKRVPYTAAVGFDGYVDRLQRVVKDVTGSEKNCYETISAFSQALAGMSGRSGDLELLTQEERLGGNAPLIANALAHLGASCTLIAAVSHPAFQAPVSYTHLDVYKRQVRGRLGGPLY